MTVVFVILRSVATKNLKSMIMKKLILILSALMVTIGAMAQGEQQAPIEYGYKQTGFMSVPKVGGYIITSTVTLMAQTAARASTAGSSVCMWMAASSTTSSIASSSRPTERLLT